MFTHTLLYDIIMWAVVSADSLPYCQVMCLFFFTLIGEESYAVVCIYSVVYS